MLCGMSDICTQLGQRLKEIREKKKLRDKEGYSQEAVAFRAGMAARYLSDVELGKKELCVRTMNRLAKALDVSLAYLMRGL